MSDAGGDLAPSKTAIPISHGRGRVPVQAPRLARFGLWHHLRLGMGWTKTGSWRLATARCGSGQGSSTDADDRRCLSASERQPCYPSSTGDWNTAAQYGCMCLVDKHHRARRPIRNRVAWRENERGRQRGRDSRTCHRCQVGRWPAWATGQMRGAGTKGEDDGVNLAAGQYMSQWP